MTHTDPPAGADTDLAAWLAGRRDAGNSAIAGTALSSGTALPTAADVLGTIDCGLLAYPYVEVYREGVKLPAAQVFTARKVQNHKVTGFVHHRNVTDQYRAGATLRFPSVADWLVSARPALQIARGAFGRQVEATAYLAAAGSPVGYAEAAADAVVLVCSGSIAWHYGEAASTPWQAEAPSALHVPAGTARGAVARGAVAGDDGDCLLLVLAERRPATGEFIKALQQVGSAHLEQQEAGKLHHLMPIDQKAAWVRSELAAYFAAMEPADLLRRVADLM